MGWKKYNAIVTGCNEWGFNVYLVCEGEKDRKMAGNMRYLEAVKYSETINYVMKIAKQTLEKAV